MSRRTDAPARSPRRAALASWIGSALEYYDFAVYGTAAAIVLNRIFFPEDTPAIGILKSMVVVGVAYVVRPFGAMIVGPLGDRYGRRFVLMLTLFLMGFATFAIGCLPTYSEAGIIAPTLLVACRMLQGLSAAGEQASSISISLEHANEHQRAFTTSWTLQGTQFGSLLATAVFIPFAALPDEHLLTWGWRVPFWLSAFVVVTAWLIRRTLSEPPAYLQREKLTESPLMLVFKHHKRAVLTIAVCAMVNTVNMVFTTFALSFATKGYGLDRSTMLLVPVASNTLGLIAIPLAAMLAGTPREQASMAATHLLSQLGLGTMLQRRIGELSGGQAQRVAIARSQVTGAPITFADEPTGALDTATAQEVMNLLLALIPQQGKTLVIVTHDPNIAAQCSRTIHLLDGQIVHDSQHPAQPRQEGTH